jgi:hypothetical protein
MDRYPERWIQRLERVGSTILAYIAFHPFPIGFVVVEVVWMVISIYALLRPRTE